MTNITFQRVHGSKLGQYSGSNWWSIPGYGAEAWMVISRLVFDAPSKDVRKEIVDFLAQQSQPSGRSKIPKLGVLKLYSFSESKVPNTYTVLYTTDRRNVKDFEGKGEDARSKTAKKLGRPRKQPATEE